MFGIDLCTTIKEYRAVDQPHGFTLPETKGNGNAAGTAAFFIRTGFYEVANE